MKTTPKRKTIADRIDHLFPCSDALKWARGYTSPAKAWAECERGDWMLWIAGKFAGPPESDGRKKLVLAACECVRLALPRYAKQYTHDNRVAKCIKTAERWANGKATIAELRVARAAAYAAYAAHAAYVARAAAYAAHAAYVADADDADDANDADDAADYAAYAAADTDDADDADDANDAHSLTLAKCAAIVRKHYPKPPRLK